MADLSRLEGVHKQLMRRACTTLLPLFILLFVSHALQSVMAETAASEFQYAAELTEGKTSLRRVELPWEVLSAIRQSGQADLRVYNADNQPVPFSIRQRDAVRSELTESRALSFFSGDNAQHLNQLLANQQHINTRHLRALSAKNRHYLIIPTQLETGAAGLTELELAWENLPQWLPKSLRVDTSDDLLQWRPVKIGRLPYVLSERGVMLENHRIRLQQAVRSQFIRLSGGQDFVALLPVLQNIRGHYQNSHYQPPELNWQTIALNPGDKAQQYVFTPPPGANLLQWRLALKEPGYMYTGEVYGHRPAAMQAGQQQKQPDWRFIRRFQQYHLQTAAGVVRSTAEPIAQLANQQWLLTFSQPLASGTVPQLEVAWQPLDVYFIAQGKGPFRLAYGSHHAKAVPAMQLDEQLMAGAENVQIAQIMKLKESIDETLDKPVNWVALLLWGVLGLSVVLLLWMATCLWRDMSGKQDGGAEE